MKKVFLFILSIRERMKMNSKSLLLAVMACFFSMLSSAQGKDVLVGVDLNTSNYKSEFSPMEFGCNLDYCFTDRFSAGARLEKTIALFKNGDTKNYSDNYTYGLRLNYTLFRINSKAVSCYGGVGNTIKKEDWRYSYYDCGIQTRLESCENEPTFGFGVRYYDSKGEICDNHFRFYISFGYKFKL